jgi:hypothetical protein
MPEPPEDLLAAVRDEAEARVRMDVQGVAKHLTPQAVDTLRASFPGASPRLAGYEIQNHESRGGDYVFEVRYSARDLSFVVRSRWRKLEDGWMVVHAERAGGGEGEKKPGVLSRLVRSLLRALGR